MSSALALDWIGHSLRRGRHKGLILLYLRDHGAATAASLARGVGARLDRTHAALHGDAGGEDYAPSKALVNIGVVAMTRRREGTFYEITELGRVVVQRIAAGERF